ncbi:FAD-dependent oxidoreductase [Nakamurella sp. GG22]
MAKPVILVVSDHTSELTGLSADLQRRFGGDYRVLPSSGGQAAVAAAAGAVHGGHEIALLIVDQSIKGLTAVEVLTRAHDVAPTAKRVLLIKRGDWSSNHPVVSAMALGLVDYHLFKPWRPLERVLYPSVSELLAAWDKSQDALEVPVRIVGSASSARSHQLRDALTRVAVPYWFFDATSQAGQQLLAEVRADGTRLPVAVFYDGQVLVEPRLSEVWNALGVATELDVSSCDLAVIGGGPAGLAAAVYGSSEGLDTLLMETAVPGGQAGTSSLIRNYLGFQRGVSGDDLANRAVEQAWLFGTKMVLSQRATALRRDSGGQVVVTTSDGSEVRARAVVIATGVSWRRIGVPALEDLVGVGVFYGAAAAEARAMQGREVFVVGAGNSAGQAAMHLSRYAAKVTMLVRGESLRTTMSEYLVSEIEHTGNIIVRFQTEVVDGAGSGRLTSLTLRQRHSDAFETVPASALFLLIGAEPHTEWLANSLARDDHGYLLTGRDLVHPASAMGWFEGRPPMLLETSMPGVFAAGDVRHRSVKRVAAAVGEGSTAVHLVHEYFAEADRGD